MSRVRSITAPIFLALFFLSGSFLFSSQAHAACATPTANAGALEWFTADTKFKYCDGTNWIVVGSAGLWTLNGSDIHYTPGNVGVGWTNPVVALDINGGLRMGDSSTVCNATYEGTLRYSSAKKVDFCDGTNWISIAGTAVPSCALQEYTTPGSYGYTVVAGCEDLMIEAYGAGGGGGYSNLGGQGGGGGGSSRVDNSTPTTLALGAGGGGGGIDSAFPVTVGGGGGGGYGQKIVTLTAGDNLTIIVGGGGQSGCGSTGGPGGSPSGGLGGNSGVGGTSTYGGGGGGDNAQRGGISTHGGSGGGGDNANNSAATTTNGGAGGADVNYPCGVSTNGGSCGGMGEGGGGGAGLGDIILQGLSGDSYGGGAAANSGPGTGAAANTSCPTAGGNGKVVIRPL
ncbi:MAG: PE-PGRS virulence associated protein [Micavibrio sp.]